MAMNPSDSSSAMHFVVNQKNQHASGGSYVARYQGRMDAAPGAGVVTIHVLSTIPDDPDRSLLEAVVEAIRRGAESVLQPLHLNAGLELEHLVIHDVDCKPDRFQRATREALSAALGAAS